MKRFLVNFSIFACVLLVFAFCLDLFFSYRLKKLDGLANGEYRTWNDIYKGNINADLVIYGSSRAWRHIDPELLSKAFNISAYNLGMDGEKFPMEYFRHKELLRYNKKPEIIIQSLDAFSLVKDVELFNYQQFLPYMLFNRRIYNATKNYQGFTIADFLLPAFRYIRSKDILSDIFNKKKANNDEVFRNKGYLAKDEKWNNDYSRAKKKMGFYKVIIDSSVTRLFENYLSECKNMNIKIIMVYTPEYIDGQHFVVNRNQIMQLYRNISDRYDVPFYDYSNDSICLQKKYFYNASHLNKEGSFLFTNMFINDLKRDKQIIGQAGVLTDAKM